MPIISTVYGDLISLAKQGKYNAIAHGCNCHGIMGSGIAPQIAEAFTGVMEADLEEDWTKLHTKERLGTFSISRDDTFDLEIINLYTQFDTAKFKGDVVVDYEAIEKVFTLIENVYQESVKEGSLRKDREILIGIPQIGCGLAGGDWEKVSEIINKAAPTLPIELVIYQK